MPTKEQIINALETHCLLRPTAEALGIGYSTLMLYIKKYGIQHKTKVVSGQDRKSYNIEKVTKARRKKKIQSLEYKGGMLCMQCGFNEPIADCYAFHHRDPTDKDPSWGKMKTNNWPFEKMKLELDKCDVLCHNCHSIVHYEMRND